MSVVDQLNARIGHTTALPSRDLSVDETADAISEIHHIVKRADSC